MKIRELLDKPEKWYNPNKNNEPDCECISTAATKVYGFTEGHEICLKILTELKLPDQYKYLYEWNDAPERTFDDVKALVEKLDI